MKSPNISLVTLLLDLLEGKDAKKVELSTKDIADFRKKSGKIYILLDTLNTPLHAALKELGENFDKKESDLIEALEKIELLEANLTQSAQSCEALKKELQKAKLPVDDGNLAVAESSKVPDDIVSKMQTMIEDYGFFLPAEKLPVLLKQFDESGGDIKVLIHRTNAQSTITTQGAKLDILPPNTKLGQQADSTPAGHILDEKEYARLMAGETLEQIRGAAKPQEDKPADFSALKPVVAAPVAEVSVIAPKEPVKPFSIAIPINRDMSYAVVISILGNWVSVLPEDIRKLLPKLDFEPDTVIHHARNRLATRFLDSGSEWSLWFDSDIIAPNGNPGWFKRRTGFKHPDEFCRDAVLKSLTRHPGKNIVSACYVQRNPGGRLLAQPGLAPRNDRDEQIQEAAKQGPRKALAEVDWVGFGCVAVHRQVFLDILAKVPGVRSEAPQDAKTPHGFFTAYEAGPTGEDIAFCKRAKEAGHPSFLDMSVHASHVGKFSFLP